MAERINFEQEMAESGTGAGLGGDLHRLTKPCEAFRASPCSPSPASSAHIWLEQSDRSTTCSKLELSWHQQCRIVVFSKQPSSGSQISSLRSRGRCQSIRASDGSAEERGLVVPVGRASFPPVPQDGILSDAAGCASASRQSLHHFKRISVFSRSINAA